MRARVQWQSSAELAARLCVKLQFTALHMITWKPRKDEVLLRKRSGPGRRLPGGAVARKACHLSVLVCFPLHELHSHSHLKGSPGNSAALMQRRTNAQTCGAIALLVRCAAASSARLSCQLHAAVACGLLALAGSSRPL